MEMIPSSTRGTGRFTNSKSRCLTPRVEVSLVLSRLYIGIVLYYTRILGFQIVGSVFLLLVTLYWGYAIRFGERMTLGNFGLTQRWVGLYLLVGLIVIVPGWFLDSLYSYLMGRG